MQNPRNRRRSNLGKRSSVFLDKPQQSQPSFNFSIPRSTTGLRGLRSAKKTPSHLNKASYELSMRKRLFQLKSPTDITLASRTPTTQDLSSYSTSASGSSSTSSNHILTDSFADITGICSFNISPSPDFHANKLHPCGSNGDPSNSKNRTKYLYDCMEPPKSPVLLHNLRFSKNRLADFKPPVDPEDLMTFKESSNWSERVLDNCAADLKILKISPGESKSISPFVNELSEQDPGSNSQLKIGQPLIEVSTEIPFLVNSRESHQFKMPDSVLRVLKSSEKLSVVNEVESESADDSFILAEQTIDSDLTIVENSNLTTDSGCKVPNFTNDELKNSDSKLSVPVLKVSHGLDFDEDIDDVLTYIDNLSERSQEMKKQQVLMERGLKEAKKQQILMEKELSQLKQAVQRLKKKKKGKQQLSVENKENDGSESSTKIKDAWIKKMKQENPSLLKTPNVRRNSRFSMADQSTIWTPHSLSNMVNDQMDDLYD